MGLLLLWHSGHKCIFPLWFLWKLSSHQTLITFIFIITLLKSHSRSQIWSLFMAWNVEFQWKRKQMKLKFGFQIYHTQDWILVYCLLRPLSFTEKSCIHARTPPTPSQKGPFCDWYSSFRFWTSLIIIIVTNLRKIYLLLILKINQFIPNVDLEFEIQVVGSSAFNWLENNTFFFVGHHLQFTKTSLVWCREWQWQF